MSASYSPGRHPSSRRLRTVKKWLTALTMACFFLAGGIEYSVILPTCWDFMHTMFGAEKWLYGLTISAMSISNFIVGPIMGAIYDRTHWTKTVVMFLLLFLIGGNFMYFAATSKYMVLGSRFVVGVGVGAGAILFGEIARTSSKKQRTTAFAIFMSTRQIGLVVGPACNLFLRACSFAIGPFKVNKWTSPALFMTFVWIVVQIMFLFFFFDLPTASNTSSRDNSPNHRKPTINKKTSSQYSPEVIQEEGVIDVASSDLTQSLLHTNANLDDKTISFEKEPIPLIESDSDKEEDGLIDTPSFNKGYGSINSPPSSKVTSPTRHGASSVVGAEEGGVFDRICWVLGEFVTEQVTLLLGLLFTIFFNQLVLETGLVPLVQELFKWTELEISLFFSGAGILLLVSFFAVSIFAKKLSDKWLITIGLVITLVSYVWDVAFLGSGQKNSWSVAQFIIGSVLTVFALPFLFVPSASLYSKFLPSSVQGFGQGIRRSVAAVASIMGPLWAGASFELSYLTHYYLFFAVPLLLVVFIMILLFLSFSKLNSNVQPTTEVVTIHQREKK